MADLELSDSEDERMSRAGNRENRDSDDNGGARSDEAEEEPPGRNDDEEDESKGRRIDPSTSRKRTSKNPQPKLNAERIQGPKGVHTMEKYFEGFKFHGKGHEKTDLDRVMKRMEHWAHRLFPKYNFDDFLEKMEKLGTKKNVQVFLKKYRLGMVGPDDDDINEVDENAVERGDELVPEETPIDEFDKLIAEQIEKQRQVVGEKISETSSEISTKGNVLGTAENSEFSDEIKARIEANRKLAMERKMAREKRVEAERKRQKLEESLVNSQVALPDSQIVEKVPNRLEKNREKGRSSGEIFGVKEMAVPNSQIVKEVSDGLTKAGENVERPDETIVAMEISNGKIEENMEKLPEGPQERPLIQEPMGTSTIPEAIEENPGGMEPIDLPLSDHRVFEQPQDDERLLTNEELLMEISGAVEEIISRGERQRSERQRSDQENTRWNGIYRRASESE